MTTVKIKHAHHWIIDRNDFGHCKLPGCDATKDFRKLQNKRRYDSPEFKAICRLGGLRSRKKKLIWEG